MAVKIFCQICEKHVKDVEPNDFQKLTGKEVCEDCGEKVGEVYGVLDEVIGAFTKKLEAEHKKMVAKYKGLDKIYSNHSSSIHSLYTTTKATLDRRMEDILR